MNWQQIYDFMEELHSTVRCPDHPDAPLELANFDGEYIIQCSHRQQTRHFGEKRCGWHTHTIMPLAARGNGKRVPAAAN